MQPAALVVLATIPNGDGCRHRQTQTEEGLEQTHQQRQLD